jgi:hypothetical protein
MALDGFQQLFSEEVQNHAYQSKEFKALSSIFQQDTSKIIKEEIDLDLSELTGLVPPGICNSGELLDFIIP